MKRWLAGLSAAVFSIQSWAIEIGYMPILPVSQLFVGLEQGGLDDLAPEAKLIQFQNGPAMVQALLGGQLDVAYLGIGPAMVAKAKGADIKVVASNIVEQISVVALPDLAESFEQGDLAGGFARFEAKHGRKPVIATFPKGSVPDTVLSYWALEGLGLTGDEFDVVHQGAAQVQQALLTGAVDGAAILEPVVSAVTTKIADARVIAAGSELFKDQPGAVLVMRESLLAENPEWARKWVAEHVKATQALANNAPGVVDAVGKYVGGGRLPKPIVEKAILQSSASFVADPTAIIQGTQVMHDFQASQGTLKAKVDLASLFATEFYPR